MKLPEVKRTLERGENLRVELMRNPSDVSKWVVWIQEPSGKSYLLLDASDEVVNDSDSNELFTLLRSIGVRSVQVML